MNYYHGTTKQNAQEILKTSLKSSEFNVEEYLTYAVKEKAGSIPKGYTGNNKDYHRVKWLGKGIYLFDSFNKKEALSWGSRYLNPSVSLSECEALNVKIKSIPEDNIFDLFSYNDIKELRLILEDKFIEYLVDREDLGKTELLSYLYVQTSIIEDLDNLFQKDPFLGGVAVDLYNLIQANKIKLIRGIYKKENNRNYYDVYYCLKDEQFLDSVSIT